ALEHRGHGASAGSPEQLGVLGETGWAGLVDDIGAVAAHARAEHPGLPLVLVAHSMGSFAAQQWVLDHSAAVDGLVLTGTAALDLLEPALDLDAPLELEMFNGPFAPARTDFDWLSRDTEQVDRYVADALCGFGLDTPGVKALFAGARALADPERVAAIRSDLPIRVVVGDQDPVNAGLALVRPLVDRFEAAGVKDVTLRVWPAARHEVFNETNRAEITADLLDWLDRVVPAR
ncbi:alpha/beta fold hydrolase, partial [Pseudonocardia pini]|uniref:alpha/beta fold hydrolase n=1 Tax=Pseudonocardia pini TaxID=2758030 RepID=UPI0015F0FDBA